MAGFQRSSTPITKPLDQDYLFMADGNILEATYIAPPADTDIDDYCNSDEYTDHSSDEDDLSDSSGYSSEDEYSSEDDYSSEDGDSPDDESDPRLPIVPEVQDIIAPEMPLPPSKWYL